MKIKFISLFLLLTLMLVTFFYLDPFWKREVNTQISIGPKPWMQEQIQRDLAYFKDKKINRAMIEETLSHPNSEIRAKLQHFKIQEGKVYVLNKNCKCKSNKPRCFACGYKEKLQKLSSIKTLPNCEFVMVFSDGVSSWEREWGDNITTYLKSAPIFTFVKQGLEGNEKAILFPDYASFLDSKYLTSGYKWIELIKATREMNKKIPWKDKVNVAYWRGAASRGDFSKPYWKTASRSQLCLLARNQTDILDAKYTKMKHISEEVLEEMSTCGIIGDYIPPKKQGLYKYHINMDGWKCTYPGFQWRLLSNSLVLKENTADIQWFYQALKPYEHYVPFEPGCQDLIEKVKWAQTHDDEAKKIAENATLFVEGNLLPQHIMAYVYFLLTEYAKHWEE